MSDLIHLFFSYPLPMLVGGAIVYVVMKYKNEELRIKLTKEKNDYRFKFEDCKKKLDYVTSEFQYLQNKYNKIEKSILSGYTLTHNDVFKGGRMVLQCHYSVLEWAKKWKTPPLLAICRLVEQYFYTHTSADIEQDYKKMCTV